MPDHIHTLFTLKQNLSLAQTQAKFKSATKDWLEKSSLVWQDNFYDHWVRQTDFLEPFARYIFLNPYRKKLLPRKSQWPGWVLNREETPEFLQHLVDGAFPPAEWIIEDRTAKDLITHDLATEEEDAD